MTTSSVVWKYFNRLDEPTRMICNLCNTILATHNCGNAKKHLRYKHMEQFFEVQATDIQSRSSIYQNKPNNSVVSKTHKKSVCSNRPVQNRLTIDQITALLMPKTETTEFLSQMSPEQCSESSLNAEQKASLTPEVEMLRKTVKIKAVELIIETEYGSEVRINFPLQTNV